MPTIRDTALRLIRWCPEWNIHQRTRRYIFIATDHASRFTFAMAATRHNSQHVARFAALVQTVFPGRIEQVLSDNGSGFQGDFADHAQRAGLASLPHLHSPKMNAFNERFNRTAQEEFIDYEKDLLMMCGGSMITCWITRIVTIAGNHTGDLTT